MVLHEKILIFELLNYKKVPNASKYSKKEQTLTPGLKQNLGLLIIQN